SWLRPRRTARPDLACCGAGFTTPRNHRRTALAGRAALVHACQRSGPQSLVLARSGRDCRRQGARPENRGIVLRRAGSARAPRGPATAGTARGRAPGRSPAIRAHLVRPRHSAGGDIRRLAVHLRTDGLGGKSPYLAGSIPRFLWVAGLACGSVYFAISVTAFRRREATANWGLADKLTCRIS